MKIGQSLEYILNTTDRLKQLHKKDVRFGDLVVVKTRNSEYHLRVLEDGYFQVSGGWFVQKGFSSSKVRITGCTWGGSLVKADIIAACGLCLEFGNRLITSPIREFYVTPAGSYN